jgi:hypothetical protein
LPSIRKPVGGYYRFIEKLLPVYGSGELFRARDAIHHLNVSRATFTRFAYWASENGLLHRSGSSNLIWYQMALPVTTGKAART